MSVKILLEALEAMGCDNECGVGYEADNPDAHDPHCARGTALRTLAAWRERKPLRDDHVLRVETFHGVMNKATGALSASDATTEILDAIDAWLGHREMKGERHGK
jgi:hypothetical protein